jgi:hypothetical protein
MSSCTRPTVVIAGLCTLLLGSSCNSDEADPLLPCPAGGLGLKTSGGKSCQDYLVPWDWEECAHQLIQSQRYDCGRAQICPNIGQRRVSSTEAGGAGEAQIFQLTNGSRTETLKISKVSITGDPRCSFEYVEKRDLERSTLVPGESAVLRVLYKPAAIGVDHAHLRVSSNAENFPTLILPICGRADRGAAPDAGPFGLDGGVYGFACKDPGAKVMPCHQ